MKRLRLNPVKGLSLVVVAIILQMIAPVWVIQATIPLDPPDRGAPSRTGDAGSRFSFRPGSALMVQGGEKPFEPKDNGGPDSSQGSGTRFHFNLMLNVG